MKTKGKLSGWLDRPITSLLSRVTLEYIIIALIILLTLFSRVYNLDLRVMSHDETNHVVPSYDLYTGLGYRHDPVTHGPFQFHIVALSYFLLGDSDFSSRLPAAIFSTLAVAFVLIFYRRYLGKVGGILAGVFFMISPFMLFYGRYTRNEAFIMLFGVVMLYAVLRYLHEGENNWLYVLTISIVMHFCSKETAYLYAAELLIFLGLLTLYDLIRNQWQTIRQRNQFYSYTILSVVIILISFSISILIARFLKGALQPPVPMQSPVINLADSVQQLVSYLQSYGLYFIPILLPLILGALALFLIKRQMDWEHLEDIRSFDLLILVGTLVLPLLCALPTKLAGIDPIDYTNQMGIYTTLTYFIFCCVFAYLIGTTWNRKIWLKNAAIFYSIFFIFYTTIFTNGFGFFTGIAGSLGYWMSQQGIQRGGQPLYYYAAIQIPMYEFLAASGTLFAAYLGIRWKKFWLKPEEINAGDDILLPSKKIKKTIPVLVLLIFWSVLSLLLFSIAGEKMPWLTVHIALPMLLCAGYSVGYLAEKVFALDDKKKVWLVIAIAFLFFGSLFNVFIILLGNQPPFQGKTQIQLQRTDYFLFAILLTSVIGWFGYRLTKIMQWRQRIQFLVLAIFIFMALLTARAAYTASFINYDDATEFLVYAHAARGPKDILAQIEEISKRTTLGLDIKIAYDNQSLYPFWWYLRHYPNRVAYMENPTRSLEDSPIILAGQENYTKLDPIVRNNYYVFEYTRLWWPMMDYYSWTWQSVWSALTHADMRQAIYNIWLNRDYSYYSQITNNKDLTLASWQPAEHMRMYIRKDVASQIWNFGPLAANSALQEADPYALKVTQLQPSQVISGSGSDPGFLAGPRGIAIAKDGSVYVADSHNNRIQHFSSEGVFINSWGKYANVADGAAVGGTFNEPWGIAVGTDGSVYVADTWNYRIQKFSADGAFLKMWGNYAQGNTPTGLYGPRGIAVDQNNHLLVTDTGNKRVVIYDSEGNYLGQFGSEGMGTGQMDEPVGITIDKNGYVYIADTWNRRIQVFKPDESGLNYSYVNSWDVAGWYGQSTNNKPYITVNLEGNIFVTDPEGSRILEFSSSGEFIKGWEGFTLSEDLISQPSDLQFDSLGRLWVSDATNNNLMRFDNLN